LSSTNAMRTVIDSASSGLSSKMFSMKTFIDILLLSIGLS
jgi:hypothetical protein